MTDKNSIIVFYHRDCSDGFGGAWAAWKKLGTRAHYQPIAPQSTPPENLQGKEVYTIDICYSPAYVNKLLQETGSLTVIDHHITNRKTVEQLPSHLYSTDHSGAILAWQYFHPGKRVPKLLAYIEDIDLWKFSLPHTKEIIASLETYPATFMAWNKLARDFENVQSLKKYFQEGKAILKYQNKIITRLVESAEKAIFEGYETLAVNSPFLISEIGARIVESGFSIGIIWSKKGSRTIVSLRSDGIADVAKIAERYGGGGHKAAASFAFVEQNSLPWKKQA